MHCFEMIRWWEMLDEFLIRQKSEANDKKSVLRGSIHKEKFVAVKEDAACCRESVILGIGNQ